MLRHPAFALQPAERGVERGLVDPQPVQGNLLHALGGRTAVEGLELERPQAGLAECEAVVDNDD
jgi:hypothetical protein